MVVNLQKQNIYNIFLSIYISIYIIWYTTKDFQFTFLFMYKFHLNFDILQTKDAKNTIFYVNLNISLPSTLTSTSSNRPPGWLIISELGKWTGPGPFNDTCGPAALPLTCTLMGQPGTGILLNDTLIICSHASAGTNETANL